MEIVVEVKYLIAGVLFVIASLTDFLDGHIARKRNMVTDFGKMTDAIADKMLVNSVLIILAAQGFISAAIPVIIVTRDTAVDPYDYVFNNKTLPSNKSFLPSKGYWGYGDKDARVGQIATFMRNTFPKYTSAKALGNYYGKYIQASIKEFQKRTGIKKDGKVGKETLAKLQAYGFKTNV